MHPVQFRSDNHHHWLPEEHPDHLSGHDDWRYCLLLLYIAYILWWLEATTSTAFSTSSGSTSVCLEVLSTQKVSLEEICFCCFHQHLLPAVTFSTKKSSPLPTTTAGGEKTWKTDFCDEQKLPTDFCDKYQDLNKYTYLSKAPPNASFHGCRVTSKISGFSLGSTKMQSAKRHFLKDCLLAHVHWYISFLILSLLDVLQIPSQ